MLVTATLPLVGKQFFSVWPVLRMSPPGSSNTLWDVLLFIF